MRLAVATFHEVSETELIDVFDDTGRPAGSVERGVAHRDGLWHRALHCWLVTGDGALLVQRRSADKAHWPGQLDISAAGHVLAGESWTSALREAHEELGLTLTDEHLIDAGERREVLRLPGMLDRELVRTVFARAGQPLESYRLGPEVAALIAIGLDDADALFGGVRAAVDCPALSAGGAHTVSVTGSEFVARPIAYYRAVVDRARRVLAGATTLPALPETLR
jgi:isopentenyldiphosphate isomerase